jgi:HEAT repeat protein
MTQSTYSFEAVVAVSGLGDVGDAAIPIINDIATLLKSDDSTIRREAARSLAKLGPRSSVVLNELVFLVAKDPSDDESWFAAEAIGEIGEPAIEHLDFLRSRLGTGAPQFDDSLLGAISKLESISNR